MKKLIVLPLLVLVSQFSLGQNYDLSKKRTDIVLSSLIKAANIPGTSIAVGINNKIVYTNSFGYSDIKNHTSPTDSTLYRIGSVTKLLTATTLVKLVETGGLLPNMHAGEVINNLPASDQSITVSQLAGHLSGIRHYTRSEIFSKNKIEYQNLEEGLTKFINDTLMSVPGEKYRYSSYGYVLLGTVMEKSQKKNFNDLIRNHVIYPSGMHSTYPEQIDRKYLNLSQFYFAQDTSFTVASGDNYSYKWPAGGYISTVTDLVKFGNALIAGKLVLPQSLSLLFTSQKASNGKETGCGYGFRISTDNNERKVVHHGGESEGARSFILIYPEEKLVIAICANVFRAPIFEGEAETIAGYFLNDYKYKKNLIESRTYNFSTKRDNKDINGEIIVTKNGGTIKGFSKTDILIIDILKDKNQIRIIAASASGLINIWLAKGKSGFLGKWGYDKAVTPINVN